MKRIAILTSGGDSPGMNAAIVAITRSALVKNIDVFYVLEGYKGLYNDQIINYDEKRFANYLSIGGTLIYSSRFPEFKEKEIRQVAIDNLTKRGIDTLVVIGGDGSYLGAKALKDMNFNVITLPGTIDNDISSTDYTIGYDTALNTIVEAVDRLRNTSQSHERVMLVEVMGRGNADLAIFGAMATAAELLITKDNPMEVEEIINRVKKMKEDGARSIIIIISEHVYPSLKKLAKQIQEATHVDTRANILAHIQRGGVPTASDRTRAWRMGNYAAELVQQGKFGVAIGIINDKVVAIDLEEAINRESTVRSHVYEKLNTQNKLLKRD